MRRIAGLLCGMVALLVLAPPVAAQDSTKVCDKCAKRTAVTVRNDSTARTITLFDRSLDSTITETYVDSFVPVVKPPAPTLSSIQVAPKKASLLAGASQAFTATATWSDGQAHPMPTVTWSATGGSVTTAGVYSAGNVAGDFRVIAAAAGKADTATVTIAVVAPPTDTTKPPASRVVLFEEPWTTLPTERAAVGSWTRWGGQGVLAIVPAAGLGFPTSIQNALRVSLGTGSFDWVEVNAKWTLPAVGESRAFRVYLRNDFASLVGNWSATHPMETKGTDGSIAGNFAAIHVGNLTSSRIPFAFATAADYPRNLITTADANGSNLGTIAKGVVYRIEWKWTRTGSATYSFDMRVSDASGAIVGDKNSLTFFGGGKLATNQTGFPMDGAAMTGIRFGINGGFAGQGTTNTMTWAGFAVCSDWCGAAL